MSEPILHHYPTSPFSEKIRAILGYKQMAWKSVFIPTVMPKPDLVALTGGYRKTPVLQIGADIYCDTKLIVQVLDSLKPDPPLIPHGQAFSCAAYEQWTEEVLFFLTVPIVMQPAGMGHFFATLPPAAADYFRKDRQALFASGNGRRPTTAATRSQLPALMHKLDRQLAASQYVLGEAPSLADFSVYHPIWFVLSNPGVASEFAQYKNVLAWARRIEAFGHGQPSKMTGEEAVQLARTSKPRAVEDTVPDPTQLKLGDEVVVSAVDYGADPVIGVLAQSSTESFAISRSDPRAGDVVVHFPRSGFKLAAAEK